MAWERIARYVSEEYSVLVDWNEEMFICPECGEPIYKCDWQEDDYFLGHKFNNAAYCPVCEEIIMEE